MGGVARGVAVREVGSSRLQHGTRHLCQPSSCGCASGFACQCTPTTCLLGASADCASSDCNRRDMLPRVQASACLVSHLGCVLYMILTACNCHHSISAHQHQTRMRSC